MGSSVLALPCVSPGVRAISDRVSSCTCSSHHSTPPPTSQRSIKPVSTGRPREGASPLSTQQVPVKGKLSLQHELTLGEVSSIWACKAPHGHRAGAGAAHPQQQRLPQGARHPTCPRHPAQLRAAPREPPVAAGYPKEGEKVLKVLPKIHPAPCRAPLADPQPVGCC